ncbi:MAG: hypothetical protein PSX36_06870 [bacterium]|nr:hypothetical protein [bacterium]
MKKFWYIACLLVYGLGVKSQLLDSLSYFMQNKYSIDARLESKVSFIDHQLTKVSGVRVGLVFKRKLKLGAGVDWLKTDYTHGLNWLGYEPVARNFVNDANEAVTEYYKLLYLCFYADFVFHKTKHWQLSVPIQTGTGASWFNSEVGYSMGHHAPKSFVFLYEPGISVQYKITKWLGGGANFCYRFALQNSTRSYVHLSSPSYAFTLIFLLDQLFYEVLPNHELSKIYGPAVW